MSYSSSSDKVIFNITMTAIWYISSNEEVPAKLPVISTNIRGQRTTLVNYKYEDAIKIA